MTGVSRYTVMVIEDQISDKDVVDEFAADRARGRPNEPYLELLGDLARNEDDAIEQLDAMEELPDAIVLDDYLPEAGVADGRAVEIMAWLCRRCIDREIPLRDRPRVVLWSRFDAELAYTFCALGGLQVVDKRSVRGERVPVEGVWAALAGRRWRPDPFPGGLAEERFRAPLPWIAAGWPQKRIARELAHLGVTENTIETTKEKIREMPFTPQQGDGYPSNLQMAVACAQQNGWVWVPLGWHERLPPGAPLPLVIDPDAHSEPLPPRGRLPERAQG